jgi:DNA-binding CsgD family transcriptional regulator
VGERAGGYELLVRAALLTGDVAPRVLGGAGETSARDVGLPLARAHAQRARALVLCVGGDAGGGPRGGHSPPTARRGRGARARRLSRPPTRSGSRSSRRGGASSPGARSPPAGDRDGAAEQLRTAEGCSSTRPPATCGRRRCASCGASAGAVNRAGRGGRADAAGPAALTARELEIARLVAGGLTNRAVAETLFLSEKTIETHLSGAFVKLGVRSRQALAAALDAG